MSSLLRIAHTEVFCFSRLKRKLQKVIIMSGSLPWLTCWHTEGEPKVIAYLFDFIRCKVKCCKVISSPLDTSSLPSSVIQVFIAITSNINTFQPYGLHLKFIYLVLQISFCVHVSSMCAWLYVCMTVFLYVHNLYSYSC